MPPSSAGATAKGRNLRNRNRGQRRVRLDVGVQDIMLQGVGARHALELLLQLRVIPATADQTLDVGDGVLNAKHGR